MVDATSNITLLAAGVSDLIFFMKKITNFQDIFFKFRIFGFSPCFLGPLCLTSLGLEGIGSSSFTFDSLAPHNIWFCQKDYVPRGSQM